MNKEATQLTISISDRIDQIKALLDVIDIYIAETQDELERLRRL